MSDKEEAIKYLKKHVLGKNEAINVAKSKICDLVIPHHIREAIDIATKSLKDEVEELKEHTLPYKRFVKEKGKAQKVIDKLIKQIKAKDDEIKELEKKNKDIDENFNELLIDRNTIFDSRNKLTQQNFELQQTIKQLKQDNLTLQKLLKKETSSLKTVEELRIAKQTIKELEEENKLHIIGAKERNKMIFDLEKQIKTKEKQWNKLYDHSKKECNKFIDKCRKQDKEIEELKRHSKIDKKHLEEYRKEYDRLVKIAELKEK